MGNLRCFRKFLKSKKKYVCQGGCHVFKLSFSVSQFQKSSLGTLRCFRKFSAGEKKVRMREGAIRIFRRIFLSHSTEKIRGESFNVSETLWYRKSFMNEREGCGGGVSRFQDKVIVSHST